MANTVITLTNEQGALVPSQPSVVVNIGDTVSFSTSDGSTAYLFFSPGAAAAITPTPSTPVEVTSVPAIFEFISSSAGAYSVYFETDSSVTVPAFPIVASNVLSLEIDTTNITFGVAGTRTRGG